MNLLCAQGLPAAEDLALDAYLRTLDDMAIRVRAETERHLYRFEQNPAEFEHSEAFFRVLMLTVVLQEDFGVRYDPERVALASGPACDGLRFQPELTLEVNGLNRKRSLSKSSTSRCQRRTPA